MPAAVGRGIAASTISNKSHPDRRGVGFGVPQKVALWESFGCRLEVSLHYQTMNFWVEDLILRQEGPK
eukprot:361231-Chlamydomonas_euryale.AAC.6